MNEHEMDIDAWLDAAEGFPDREVVTRIEETERELRDLREKQLRLIRRLNALQSLVQTRAPIPGQTRFRIQAEHAASQASRARPEKIGTSAAVLSLMREAPEDEWAILDIYRGLGERGQLPTSKDPRRALDATIHRLGNVTHQIERVGKGRYRLTPSGAAQQPFAVRPDPHGGERTRAE
jgi:hypothetical protein